MSNDTPTPAQIRAGLAMLKWDYPTLSKLADVSVDALSRICLEKHEATARTRGKIRSAFEANGLDFIEGQGVRFKTKDIEVYEGIERFQEFTDFIYSYLKKNGGEVCISAVDEGLFSKYRSDPELHRSRMRELKENHGVIVRILAAKSKFSSSYAVYKQIEAENTAPTAFYAFGNCLALISFDHDPAPYVVLHQNSPFAAAYRHSFNHAWETAKDPK